MPSGGHFFDQHLPDSFKYNTVILLAGVKRFVQLPRFMLNDDNYCTLEVFTGRNSNWKISR